MPFTFEQGHLDGLCGLYSIVNAITYVARLRRKTSRDLFRVLNTTIRDVAPLAVTHGLYGTELWEVVEDAQFLFEESIRFTRPFRSIRFDGVADYLDALAEKVNDTGACAILGLGEPVNHWTVTDHIWPKSISLRDSAGYRRMNAGRMSLTACKGKVRIHPRQTVLVSPH